MGHEDAFPPPRLSGRCRFSQGTFAATRGNGRDAPTPDLGETAVGPAYKIFSGHSAWGLILLTGNTWSLVPIAV
jgi:hypothetical protein